MAELEVYMAKFYRDRQLSGTYDFPEWLTPIQVGAALTDARVADILDCTGENISYKNVNYCELTALYWIWKNRLLGAETNREKYYGLFHYRRILDINEEDIRRMADKNVDVLLPFPTIHEPDIREHHQRYVKESDWDAMLQALKEIEPKYYEAYDTIFSQQYLYNYNILVAKAEILVKYCEWLFPILERAEELSVPKGNERADRYIGYLGENLLTLYFLYHSKNYKIAHTGRIMLT